MEDILKVCEEPVSVTKVVYQCNLYFHTVRIHFERLIDAGLLDVYGTDQIWYQTTAEGMKALEHINAFRTLLMPAAKSLDKLASAEGL